MVQPYAKEVHRRTSFAAATRNAARPQDTSREVGWQRQAESSELADGPMACERSPSASCACRCHPHGDGILQRDRRNGYSDVMLDGERYTKRCHRWDMAGHAHELTFTCYQYRQFLSKERTCGYLADAITSAKAQHGFDLWAYVFMPNHVHLIIHPRQDPYSIARILRSIKQPVSRRALEYLRRSNPEGLRLLATGQQDEPYQFWQKGGGYDRNITKIETLTEAVRYIHDNPVRKGLVETADQWCYSSAADWQSIRPGPIPIDFDTFPRR